VQRAPNVEDKRVFFFAIGKTGQSKIQTGRRQPGRMEERRLRPNAQARGAMIYSIT